MRLSVRLNLSLIAGVTIVSLGIALYQTQTERSGLKRDLERQALVLAESLGKSATPLMAEQSVSELQSLADYFQNHERLAGVAVYDAQGQTLAATPDLTARLGRNPAPMDRAAWQENGAGQFFRVDGKLMHVYELPVRLAGTMIGAVAVYHDANYIQSREMELWRHVLAGLAVQTVLIVCVTLLILQWSLRRPLARLTKWLGEVRRGSASRAPDLPQVEGLQPLQREVTRLATSLNAARAAAEQEARLRDAGESLWTAERLRISVQSKLDGTPAVRDFESRTV